MRYLFLTVIFFFGCKHKVNQKENVITKTKDIIKCKNNPDLYTSIKGNLLYKDSLNRIYLKRKNVFPKDYGSLSKCQKLPFVFLNAMALKNDSIIPIENIIDINTFSLLSGTNMYFIDKNRVYAYKDDIATWPPFYELKISTKDIIVIDSFKIRSKDIVYVNGIKKE